MDFKKMVLVTTVSGEKMIGTFDATRERFENDARHGRAVIIENVRNMTITESQKPVGNGQVMMVMSVGLMALPPFSFPIPRHYVRLSGWVYLGAHPELHTTITALVAQAERREQEMRASAAGIELASSLG